MIKLFSTSILLSLLTFFWFVDWVSAQVSIKPKTKNIAQWNESKIFDADKKDNKVEQKNETKNETKNEDKTRLYKNLNNLLIESYKIKYNKILLDLKENIKNKSKEDKLKILSTVIYSTQNKIDLIESGKIVLTDNRREILISILTHIKDQIEAQIQEVAKEK